MSFHNCLILLLCIEITLSYKTYYLSDLCTSSKLKKIVQQIFHDETVGHLDPEGIDSAGVVRLAWNSSTFKRYADCRFKFQVPKPYGLYATIRKIKLRRSPSGECYDSVKFKNSLTRWNNICGDIDMTNVMHDGSLQFSAEDPGVLTVTVMLDNYRPLAHEDDTLEILIVFTAYERCEQAKSFQVMCSPGHCVSKVLRTSGLLNCPPILCQGEEMCVSKAEYDPTINGSKIALSAITSLIFTMLAVGLCLWLCWKYSTCRSNIPAYQQQQQQQQRSGNRSQLVPTTTTTNAVGTTGNDVEFPSSIVGHGMELRQPPFSLISIGVGHGSDNGTGNALPTAPSTETIVDDKDLPPSYESLFPIKSTDTQTTGTAPRPS